MAGWGWVWRCVLFLLFLLFPSCSGTVFNASPSAHDQSAAALRRPPARHLAALRLFLEAPLLSSCSITPQQVDKSSGLEDRRKYTPRGRQPEHIAKAGAVHRGGNFAVAAYFIYIFSPFRICEARSWIRRAAPRLFLPEYNQMEVVIKPEWILGCNVESLKEKEECRLGWKARERRTGITRDQHVDEQGLPADPHCSSHTWRMPNSGSWSLTKWFYLSTSPPRVVFRLKEEQF